MSIMKVEINLDDLGRTPVDEDGEPIGPPQDLRALVADMAASRLFALVWGNMESELRQQVHEVVNEEVREQVRKHVVEALSKPIQKTTRWGEKQGEATSLLELVRLELERFLSDTTRRDSFRLDRDKPENLADLVRDQVQDYARTELSKDIQAARNEVTRMVKEAIMQHVTDSIAKSR